MRTSKIELKRLLAIAFAGTLFVTSSTAADETATGTNIDIETLEKQIQSLDQEVRELKHQQNEDQKTTTQAFKSQSHLSVGAGRHQLRFRQFKFHRQFAWRRTGGQPDILREWRDPGH